MSLRSLLGLCDHRWKPTGKMLQHSVGLAQGYGEKIVTGHTDVRECEHCGAIKGFRV